MGGGPDERRSPLADKEGAGPPFVIKNFKEYIRPVEKRMSNQFNVVIYRSYNKSSLTRIAHKSV